MEKMLFSICSARDMSPLLRKNGKTHFVHYLTDYKGYPKGLLANEIQLDLNGTKKTL